VVERQLPKLYVVGSIPIARSIHSEESLPHFRDRAEAIEGRLAVDVAVPKPGGKERIFEIAV
jgi:hypothetical protein